MKKIIFLVPLILIFGCNDPFSSGSGGELKVTDEAIQGTWHSKIMFSRSSGDSISTTIKFGNDFFTFRYLREGSSSTRRSAYSEGAFFVENETIIIQANVSSGSIAPFTSLGENSMHAWSAYFKGENLHLNLGDGVYYSFKKM